jgi:hypothetical protein
VEWPATETMSPKKNADGATRSRSVSLFTFAMSSEILRHFFASACNDDRTTVNSSGELMA